MTGSSLVTYTYFGPSFAHGGAQPSINIAVIHDVEADPDRPRMARSLCGPDYFGHGGDAGNPTSIHYIVGADDICQGTDENTIAWHVGNGNSGTLGLEQLGFASYSRDRWLQLVAQLHNLAALMRDISTRHPLIRLRWLTDDELVYAWHNKTTPGGWTTHAQMTRVGLGSTHTDPGSGWPADYVMSLAQGGIPSTDWFDMATVDDLNNAVANQLYNYNFPKMVNDVVAGVLRAPEFQLALGKIRDEILTNVRFEYQNQPPDSHATNNVVESLNATNGEVYRLGPQVAQILAILTAPKA